MKKLLFVVVIVFALAFNANAVEWRTANQATIAWDAVTTFEAGDPIPENHVIRYRVYIKPDGAETPGLLGETDTLQFIVTLAAEGRFIVGVQSVRYDENNIELSTSEINWSDVNGEATPNPFGLVYWLSPAVPINLR
jgi:hypothetical protein